MRLTVLCCILPDVATEVFVKIFIVRCSCTQHIRSGINDHNHIPNSYNKIEHK